MEYSPYSDEYRDDPYPIYRQLRDEHPAYYNPDLDFWVLSRYDDILAAIQDVETYSSVGALSIGAPREVMDQVPMLILLDPPRHDQLRALVNRAFTPRRIAGLEGRIRKLAAELVDDFEGARQCDIVGQFAGIMPTTVIAELLGVGSEGSKFFREKVTALVSLNAKESGDVDLTPAIELVTYITKVYEERRLKPRDDLMSALLEAEIDGQRLDQSELVGFAMLLLVAGTDTTTNLISNSMALLAQQPDIRSQLVDDPSLLPAAVEEFVRFESPVASISRTLTCDVEIHGQKMREGQQVVLLYGSANRDERIISNPDQLDITRSSSHLGFGFGRHYCLGANLARMEGRLAFEELLPRLPDFQVHLGKSRRSGGGVVRGWANLGVSW